MHNEHHKTWSFTALESDLQPQCQKIKHILIIFTNNFDHSSPKQDRLIVVFEAYPTSVTQILNMVAATYTSRNTL